MSTEPVTRMSVHAWPHARGTRSSLIAQFGADRADLAGWALTTGDRLADAVVADIHDGHPHARQADQLGIRHGLDSKAKGWQQLIVVSPALPRHLLSALGDSDAIVRSTATPRSATMTAEAPANNQ
jgi:hypothetical protein